LTCALVVSGLTRIFNHNIAAVDHISFNVKEEEIFGSLGSNGDHLGRMTLRNSPLFKKGVREV